MSRDWHHKIIKLDQAITLLPSNLPNTGNNSIVIGVMEGNIEFEHLSTSDSLGFDYKAVNLGLDDYKDSSNNLINKKINYVHLSSIIKPIFPSANYNDSSDHATKVSGIIGGRNLTNSNIALPIKGIFHSSFIHNFNNTFLFNFLVNSGVEYNVFLANANAVVGDINDSTYKFDIFKYIFDTNFNKEKALCSVINSSILYTEDYFKFSNDRNKNKVANINVIQNMLSTIKAYSRDGRGVLICIAAGNSDKKTTNEQYLSLFDYPLIIAASCVSNEVNLNNVTEFRAGYSDYGDRIDLCAPSSGKFLLGSSNEFVRRRVFTTTNKYCGDIGTDDEVVQFIIQSVNGNNSIVLDRVKGLFSGNCVEIGNPTSDQYEVMIIDNVNYATNEVTFTEDRYFTIGSTALVGSQVRIPIMKNYGTLTNNRIILSKKEGIGYVEQEIYIGNNLIGHKAKVTSILSDTGFEFNPQLPSGFVLPFDFYIVPGQTELNIISTELSSSSYIFQVAPSDGQKLRALFIGEAILVYGIYNDNEGGGSINVKYKISIKSIDIGAQRITVDKVDLNNINITTLKTIGYGSYTSSFGGTSSASPTVAGVSGLLLLANSNLNYIELKHILKVTTDQIGGVDYNHGNSLGSIDYNFGYAIHEKYGTGRVNAERAVQLALDWHDPAKYGTTVLKPRLEIADKLVGNTITNVTINEPVDSPDIWVSELANSNTIIVAPFNQINTSKKQYINIKVLNTGNRNSFKECDLRVFVAFTDDVNPAFPFPTMWFDQTEVKLLAVKEIPIIPHGDEAIIQVEWEDIATKWNTWNPIVGTTGKRKRAYILAHIAPFDGLSTDVQTDNIRNNKQLTCKEIIVTHNGVSDRKAYLPGNNLNITVGSEVIAKSFDFTMENILTTGLTGFKIKVTKMNNDTGHTVEEVYYKKTGTNWAFETTPSSNWIAFDSPTEIVGNHPDYTNLKFPHTFKVNNDLVNVKLEIVPIA